MKRVALVAMLVVGSASSAWAQRLRITVGGANFRPYPVAAPALVVAGDAGKELVRKGEELTETLQTDIDLARPLELVPTRTYLSSSKDLWAKPDFQNWVNVGASGLVRGSLEGGARQKMNLRFYDVVAQREVLARTYDDVSDTSVHAFIDEVLELLTGEPGIFSSKIAFVKKTSGGKAIFVSDVDGKNARRLTDETQLSLLPGWDPTGRFVLFTSYLKGNPDLFRLDRSNGDLAAVSSKRGLNTGASVSPDGKRVALTLSVDGNTEIYVMDWNGDNVKRLTDSWGQDVSPTWSPDGKRIAFVSSRAGNPHIYLMNADGSGVRRLTFQGNYNQEPDWSPREGGQIAFTARDERFKFDIFLVNPDSGEITRLTQDEGNNESPSHSPDGHHITFISGRPPYGQKKLFVMDVDGNNQRKIAHDNGEYETPSWGPRLGYR
jgi:TolB protein